MIAHNQNDIWLTVNLMSDPFLFGSANTDPFDPYFQIFVSKFRETSAPLKCPITFHLSGNQRSEEKSYCMNLWKNRGKLKVIGLF